MTLRELQSLHANLIAQLFTWMYSQGYEITWGEAKRSDEQAIINSLGQSGRENVARLIGSTFPSLAEAIRNNGKANGIVGSLHEVGLALDFNLFRNGVWITDTESTDWQLIGSYWELLHPLCRWGGRFKDGNHFSITYNGKK